jgi:hypothetical protein
MLTIQYIDGIGISPTLEKYQNAIKWRNPAFVVVNTVCKMREERIWILFYHSWSPTTIAIVIVGIHTAVNSIRVYR